MRTRSQPLSPGGLVALEAEKQPTRQTRSMRMRSASQNSAQSTSQSSQDDSQQPETQASKPVTRSRSQSTTKNAGNTRKTTGAKKATTTKKSTTAKTATTKRAATARKTDTTAKTSSKPTKAPASHAMKTRAERKSTRKTAAKPAEEEPEDEEFHDASESPEPAEADALATQSTIPDENSEKGQKATDTASSAVEVLLEPKTSDRELSPSIWTPVHIKETQGSEDTKDELNSFEESMKQSTSLDSNIPVGQSLEKTKEDRQQLTATTVNRKRPRANSNESDQTNETPSAKRRTLLPPRSTSLARRLGPLSRRLSTTAVPYAERLRRRQAERQGRIHTTVFRLPELVAQTEADRRASEVTPSSPCPPAPQNSFDFSEAMSPSRNQDESSAPQEPRTPETPKGWNIRGLLSSVPRSFSRLLPSFGRSSERNERSANQTDSSAAAPPSSPPNLSVAHPSVPATPSPSTKASSTERTGVTPKTAPAKKSLPDLSYDLFPRPINRELYLPRAAEPSARAEANGLTDKREEDQSKQSEQQNQEQAPSVAAAAPAEERQSRQATETPEKRKRKRAPSPDVIPNPPGCSYGLDLDYFCYSSESDEEEAENEAPPAKPTPPVKSAARSAFRSESHPSKKVRFDASPDNTPSKLRGRATDPYHGSHFLGPGDSPTKAAPASPTPAHAEPPVQRPPGFVFNHQGSFGFDYDDFSDDSTSSGPSSPASIPSPSSNLPEPPTAARSQVQDSTPSAPHPAPRQAPSVPPSTPLAKADNEALAKVRSQAEKYKPKTPSGLRTASRYSTSPMVASPDVASVKGTEPEQQVIEQRSPGKEIKSEKPVTLEKPAEKFGDDQYARDAEWLYEKCPSGDLSKLSWPEKQSLVDSLGIEPEAQRILNDIWHDSDVEAGHSAFRRGMEEFAATLV